jgi:hypothetical protein
MEQRFFLRHGFLARLCCILCAVVGCAQTSCQAKTTSPDQATAQPNGLGETPAVVRPGKAANVEQPNSIGAASMKPDGTIVLLLRASDGTGMVGDGRVEYPPSHPQYNEVLKHLGGLKPGEEKPVPPWPE